MNHELVSIFKQLNYKQNKQKSTSQTYFQYTPQKTKTYVIAHDYQANSKSQNHVEAWVVFHSTDTGTGHFTSAIPSGLPVSKEQLDLVHYHSCLYYINISQLVAKYNDIF